MPQIEENWKFVIGIECFTKIGNGKYIWNNNMLHLPYKLKVTNTGLF